jgi:hypothetical protein
MKKRKPANAENSGDAAPPTEPSFVAWENNPQAQALRVDLQSDAFFVLPYSHFAFAHFQREGDSETLRVTFSSHEVRVNGRNLRELGLALQKLGVDWIREAPARYAGLAARGCTFIERIEIAEMSEEDASHD